MIAYQKEKIDNAVCFFAGEYEKRTHKHIPQAVLYKLLAFLDFYSVRDTGTPALGLKYCAMETGPVPVEIDKNKPETGLYMFLQSEDYKYVVISKKTPDLDYFSRYETEEMEKLVEIYAESPVKTKNIGKSSHEEIRAWKKAYQKKPDSIIDYKDMFNECFEEKGGEKLSSSEERYIIQKCITESDE